MAPIRTFIAFETPEDVRNEVRQAQMKLIASGAEVRWESHDKFHITVKFLGNVEERSLPAVLSTINSIAGRFTAFQVVYENLGCFPTARSPRVIWIGCRNDDGTLASMKKELDGALEPLGFEIEDRDFRPHLTLGRVKGQRKIEDLISMVKNINFGPRTAMIDSIIVVKSDLRPGGSLYTSLQRTRLLQ